MGQKVHPYVFRIKNIYNWKSRWLNRKKYREFLKQDVLLRDLIMKKLSSAGIKDIEIERLANSITILIQTARPGLVIGRGGEGVESLKKELEKIIRQENPKEKINLKLEIQEIRKPETEAAIIAKSMAEQIEKRVPYRRVLKRALAKIMENKEVKGAKVQVKGRLDGAEIARTEWLKEGRLPLQSLRANIDYAQATAYTTYGTVGIKVWIYKGEVFEKEGKDNKKGEIVGKRVLNK